MASSSHRIPPAASLQSTSLGVLCQTLCEAIAARKVVAFTYKGRRRTAQPHILGVDHEGEVILSAWQLSGGSGVAFRTYRLSALSDLAPTAERFARPRPEYNPRHAIFAKIACQL